MGQEEAFDPAAVNDVETARLALRWALEQVHSLRCEIDQLKKELVEEQGGREALLKELQERERSSAAWKSNARVWEREALELELRDRLAKELRGQFEGESASLRQARAAAEAELARSREAAALENGRIGSHYEAELARLKDLHQRKLIEREALWEERSLAREHELEEKKRGLAQQERALNERFTACTQELLQAHARREAELEQAFRDKEARLRELTEEVAASAAALKALREKESGARASLETELLKSREEAALECARLRAAWEEERRRLKLSLEEGAQLKQRASQLEIRALELEQEAAAKSSEAEARSRRAGQTREIELLAQYGRAMEAARGEFQAELRRAVDEYESRLARKENELAEALRLEASNSQAEREASRRSLSEELKAREAALADKIRTWEERSSRLARREAEIEAHLRAQEVEFDEKVRRHEKAAEARLQEALWRERESLERHRARLDGEARALEDELETERRAWRENMARREKILKTDGGEAAQAAGLKDLLSGISRQIRDPLGVIKTHAQFCLSRGSLPQEEQNALQAILRNADKLLRRLQELFDFTKPLAPAFVPVSLAQAAASVLSLVEERCARSRVVVDAALPANLPPLLLDQDLLSKALLHIVSNALEAMPEGGRLALSLAAEKGAQVLRVADTGPGIPAARAKELFSPFFTTHPGAVGLGLAIARRFMEAMQADLQLESSGFQGTIFRVTFPPSSNVP